jgi:hypothetical protein
VTEPDLLGSSDAGPAALRGGALRTAGYAAGLIVSLVSVPILIRHLGVADFGRYTTVVALVAIAAGITEGGLNAIVQREYVTLTGERRVVALRQLLGIRILLTLAGVGAATAFGVVAGYDEVLVLGIIAAGAGLLLASVQAMFTSVLQAAVRLGDADRPPAPDGDLGADHRAGGGGREPAAVLRRSGSRWSIGARPDRLAREGLGAAAPRI